MKLARKGNAEEPWLVEVAQAGGGGPAAGQGRVAAEDLRRSPGGGQAGQSGAEPNLSEPTIGQIGTASGNEHAI